jgi:hypothetical protein
VTKDRPRKKAIRSRMAVSGEPYSVAARNLGSATPPGVGAVGEIIACARTTLAEPSARIAHRSDFEVTRTEPRASPGPVGRLVMLAGKALWERVSGGADVRHAAAEGFLEPASRRYMLDFGWYAEIGADGVTFSGRSGRSLQGLRPSSRHEGDVLWLLKLLAGTTAARLEDTETLRGTPCRKYALHVDVARAAAADGRAELPLPSGLNSPQPPVLALTVWTDGQHIRQVRFVDRLPKNLQPGQPASTSKVLTLEIWDFGVPVRELDWSRLPNFRTPPLPDDQPPDPREQSSRQR